MIDHWLPLPGILVVAALLLLFLYMAFAPWPGQMARYTKGERVLLERKGQTLVYYQRGAGQPIVLAASAGRESSDFNELTDALVSAGYRTVTIEAAGIGEADFPEHKPTLYDLAADMEYVLDDAVPQQEQVTVLGHAFGNRLVRAFAHRYPERVKSVVLVAAGGIRAVPDRAAKALRRCFNPILPVSIRLKHIRYAFFADGNTIPDYWLRGWHADTAVMQGQANGMIDSSEWWGAGGKPILLIQGLEDRIAPKKDTADLMLQEFGDRVQVVLAGRAGHALLPERPELIASSVVRFLEEQYQQ
ncbi:MAG: alpha/beta fold hydrolase [Gammaproteobacteria bacterium]